MSEVFERFSSRFAPRRVVEPEPERRDEAAEQARREMIADARTFVSTQTYRDLRADIEHEIKVNSPHPSYGSDVATCYTFTQQGLRKALELMDKRVRLAEEALAHDTE